MTHSPDEHILEREDLPQLAELERLIEAQRDVGRRLAADAREAELRRHELRDQLVRVRAQYDALRGRRVVKIALRVAAAIARLRRLVRRAGALRPGRAATSPVGARPPTPQIADEETIVRQLVAEAARPARASGPLVSIVMLNRDGAAHLARTLPALARMAYRDVELIVVDNGSTDASLDLVAAFDPGFPVRLIRNEENRSFSDANNQGAEIATGDLLLFLNNDVEPVGPHWLGHLVDTLDGPDVVAAGARLVYPRGVAGPRAGKGFANLAVQHAGVKFRMHDGAPVGDPIGAGGAANAALAARVEDVPALTAACLLVRPSAFWAVGGFTPGYEYGQEDVDLCLKLGGQGGRLVYDGRVVLWHHESATRALEKREPRLARIAGNRARLVARWAPSLYRTVMTSALEGDTFWRGPLRVGVVPSRGGIERRPPLADHGWIVAETVGDETPELDAIDILVVADPERDLRGMPPGAVRVAWLVGDPAAWLASPWLADFDVALAPDQPGADAVAAATGLTVTVVERPEALVDALVAWVDAPRIAIRIGVPSWKVAPSWGDLHFARDLQRALRRRGHPTRIQLRPEWDQPYAARDDVAIHLFGLHQAPTHPGQVNVLWHISHPDLASPELYGRYDLVFVASTPFAQWMQRRVDVPVRPLHQATDPNRFRPAPGGPAHELLFVANSRGVRRHILDDLLPTPHDLAVFGTGWTPERLDPRHLGGEHVPNDDLGYLYAAAAIVLNDHWRDMQREGFLSNRLYDASAAGAFVISDLIEGLGGEFDGGIVGYVGSDELRELVVRFLADPAARAEHAARARAAVLARHTFDHRAAAILEAVEPLEAARSRCLSVAPRSAEAVAEATAATIDVPEST